MDDGYLAREGGRMGGAVRQAVGIGGECWLGRMDLLKRLVDCEDEFASYRS